MRCRGLSLSVLIILAACQGSETTQPSENLRTPSLLISDGGHSGGNPDFFFLSPMVQDPSGNANYGDPFNPNLRPTVKICALDATTQAAAPTASCKVGGYSQTTTLAGPNGSAYQQAWTIPTSSDIFYRIEVFVGLIRLGFAEVFTAPNNGGLIGIDPNVFVPRRDGSSLPIKFRIEQNALCQGVSPCTSRTINLATGGIVTTDLTTGAGTSGLDVPAQGTSGAVTFTVTACDDLNPRATDLTTFDPCVSITATPPLPPSGLAAAATVFICELPPSIPAGMLHEQEERITLHRFDAPNTMTALPHTDACATSVGSNGSLKGFFADLRRGALRSAGRQLAGMVSPRPLHAAVINLGAGSKTKFLSDFQFALPATLEIVEGDAQSAIAGTAVAVNPKVIVKDLGGDPIEGTRVRFAATAAACAALSAGAGTNSASDGTVSSGPWVLSATPGTNNISACGRGLAGVDFNGPRTGVDPFQPIQAHFDGSDPTGGPVETPVLLGSVTFTATGITLPATLVSFGAGGYNTYGPCAFSGTPAAGTTNCVPPPNWPSPTAAVSPTIGSVSPFRGVSTTCAITPTGTVTFPTNRDIFVTKTFTAPVAGTLQITVWIDNDLKIWLDGVEKTNLIPATSNGSFSAATAWWQHFNCANLGPAVLNLPVSAGAHTISMWAHDWGTVAYLNMQVVLNPPSP